MERFTLGTLVGRPVARAGHLLAAPVAAMLQRLELEQVVGVAEIDPPSCPRRPRHSSATVSTRRRW